MNYWIFTVKDAKIETFRKKGIEIYKQRMSDAFWGLGKNVSNRARLREGDRVVFYLGGPGGQRFLGTCALASDYYKLSKQEKRELDHGRFFQPNFGVRLTDVDVWDSSEPIRPLMRKLPFIRNPNQWGSYLQGSIRRISEDDYHVIVSTHELEAITSLSEREEPSLTNETCNIKVNKKARDNAFREGIREIYGYSCAVCAKRRFTLSNHPEVDSAHIYPKEKNGSDDFRNGIALCKLHHWAFDGGLFSIRDDYSIVVEKRIRNNENYEEIYRFENRKIRLPQKKGFKPHPIFLKAHRKIHGFT